MSTRAVRRKQASNSGVDRVMEVQQQVGAFEHRPGLGLRADSVVVLYALHALAVRVGVEKDLPVQAIAPQSL